MREILHRPAAAMHTCSADLDKAQGGMKRFRFRVRRAYIDLAENLAVSGLRRMLEQILIKPACAAAPARRRCDDDPVDIDKARIARAKPPEIRVFVFSILIECQQEGVDVSDSSREECLPDEMLQPFRLEPGKLRRMGVIERQQRFARRS
jgi:hypothetical protein